MKRTFLVAGALLLLGAGARAQEDTVEKLQKETDQVFNEGRKKGAPDLAAITKIVDRAVDLATDHKGDDVGFEAYSFALQLVEYVAAEKQATLFPEVMDGLIESYVNDDRMAQIAASLQRVPASLSKKADEYFDWIERDSKSESVKGTCAYLRLDREAAATVDVAKSKALVGKFEELKQRIGDKPGPYGQSFGEMIDEAVAGLKIAGTPAKATAGKDLDGVEFKLAEYRGKVVLLDFWGYW